MSSSLALPLDAARAPGGRAWTTLGVLTLVYLLNFLDRTLIYVLFPLLKAELHFSDLALALLGSTSFVLFYTSLGVPFGRLADRVSRPKLIAAGLVTWSVFSGLTGLADGFWSLFVCRVMVGVGEATLGPAAMSLLSDHFPSTRRATVQSVYASGIPLGAAAAFFLGAHLGAAWGWRTAFFCLGFPGVLLAAFVWTLPEPPRGATEGAAPTTRRDFWRQGTFLRLVGAYAIFAVAANSLSIWVPSLLGRARGVPLETVGNLGAFAMLVGGGLGTFFGGSVADRLRRRHPGGRLLFTAGLALACVPLWSVLLYSSNLWVLVPTYTALAAVGLAWLGPAAADVHDLAGPAHRGVATALYFLVVNLVGYGAAPPLVGWLSDHLGAAADPGRLAWALLSAPACCLLAAALLLHEARRRQSPSTSSIR